jgi:hypothetical protein
LDTIVQPPADDKEIYSLVEEDPGPGTNFALTGMIPFPFAKEEVKQYSSMPLKLFQDSPSCSFSEATEITCHREGQSYWMTQAVVSQKTQECLGIVMQ